MSLLPQDLASFNEIISKLPLDDWSISYDCMVGGTFYDSSVHNEKYRYEWREPEKYHVKCKKILQNKIETGGAQGGSCWGDTATEYYISSQHSFSLDDVLIPIIGVFFPNISLYDYTTKFKNTDLIQTCEKTEYEYYGNYTSYKIAYISIEALYNKLKEYEQTKT